MNDRNQELNKETNEQQQKGTGDNLRGRLDNTANPDYQKEENKPDISQVDRQEGSMDNGELGGNLNEASTKNT
jgi:hypothetical protein